ncbi:MAG: AAA family ATPase [Cyanobacteria bacterium J06626_6]
MGVDLMPFADNWAYLKTELAWLDRLLMLAIARQRKDAYVVNKVAATHADQLSSHWWKGVISVPNPGYDDCRVPSAKKTCRATGGYQNQLESRIKISAQGSVVLALPSLRHYLNLSLFEKNLILMVLAPEVNRRYGKLYHYLQTGEETAAPTDLPMVDLALRLLCRNDLERRRARAALTGPHSLIEKKILRYVSLRPSTRLSSYLQLTEDWVNYLLEESPDQQVLFKKLATQAAPMLALPAPTAATRAVQIRQPEVSWDQLILPTSLISQLQTLCQQTSAGLITRADRGYVVLLVGDRGTGKKMAAEAIATSMRQSLCEVDLAQVHPSDWLAVLNSLEPTRYPVLLIKSASAWFGRASQPASAIHRARLHQWLQQRQTSAGLTLLSTRSCHLVQARWRQRVDSTLTLPVPHKAARKLIWWQAFSGIACSSKLDWMDLAAQLKVTGGEISAIAQQAIAIAQAKNAKSITLSHIQQAIKQRGLSTTLAPSSDTSGRAG